MKFIYTILALIISVSLEAQVDRSRLPEAGTPKPIEIGDYESFTLKNGLKVFVIENHKLPRVAYRLQLDREPLLENDKVGYLSMVGDLMQRGTTNRTKEQLDEEVDFIGASLSVGSQSAFASGLSKYKEKVLELMSDVILNPTFPEEELEKIRKQTLSALEANKAEAGSIASNLASKIVYGEGHPYGEISTEETVNNIELGDIKSYHRTYYKPNIAYLAVVGDVNTKEVKKLVNKYFSKWQAGEITTPEYVQPKAPESNVVALVNRPASVQSTINVTYPVLLKPSSPDVIPADVTLQILGGGGLASRLNMNLREDKGFTYGSYASLSENELVSRFNASAEVRNEVTDSAVTEILYEMDVLGKELVTDNEIDLARNAISGRFARSLESPQTVASFAINSALYDLPADYYSTYVQKIQAVTKEDVKAIAQKYILPTQSYITIVGKAADIEAGLQKFGEISYYDTYGNEVDPAMAKLPAGLTADKVFEQYFTAMGGKAQMMEIKSVKTVMKANAMGQELVMTKIAKNPKMLSIEVAVGGNVMSKQVYNGTGAKVTQMGQNLPVDDATKAQLELEAAPFPELLYSEMGVKTKLSGLDQVNGKDAYMVEVTNPDGKSYLLYFGKESGLMLRKSQTLQGPNGQSMTLNTDFNDYKKVEGVMFPQSMKIPLGPGMQADATLESVEVNAEISEEIFNVD